MGIGEKSLAVLFILIITNFKTREKKGKLHTYSNPVFQKKEKAYYQSICEI